MMNPKSSNRNLIMHVQQASEGQIQKLGSDALEPRQVSIPLPGSEVQAMTPAYKKMLRRLEDSVKM